MTEDKNMIKIQALEDLQKILINRAEMLFNVCFTEEAKNIYDCTYGERFDRLTEARYRVLTKNHTILEIIETISRQIMNLCME